MKRFIFASGVFSIFLLILTCGCGDSKTETKVSRINVIQGASQCALPESRCSKKIKVELLGPQVPGFLGGKGNRYPVPGAKVRFVAEKGLGIRVVPTETVSDHGGIASAEVFTGRVLGDHEIRIEQPDNPKASASARVINGIKISNAGQEAGAESRVAKPLVVELLDQYHKPLCGAPVYFKLSHTPEVKPKASVSPGKVLTDKNGIAEAKVKVGEKTGTYTVTVEVADKARGFFVRGIELPFMGLNIWSLVIKVLGGLAIFIYGMKLMTEGLQLVAGSRLKSILKFFTRNRLMAVLAGTVVTGAIQSSSACTVMVVGFVNAGLLSLQQAIGVVFGANIGTTVTAQMISFKLTGLALPAVVVGLLVIMIAKRPILKGWGQTVIGFGLLFYGMHFMGSELKLISKFPSFINFFSHFDCSPVNGSMPISAVLGAIAIGTLMTVLIQSSSATIGIAMALAMSGLINFYTAVPLILGDNIGTTVTALLASVPANPRAKQTAVAHMLFNVLGTTYMVILFFVPYPGTSIPIFLYFINYITPGDVFAIPSENIARHIAMAHTLFNVFNVIIFLPFIALIGKLCSMIIRIKDESLIKTELLEPHLLNTPSAAIEQVVITIHCMLEESWSMVESVMNKSFLQLKKDHKLFARIGEKEKQIDKMQEEITDYLVKLANKTLTVPQSRIIPLLMHCTNDAERIADHSEKIVSLTSRVVSGSRDISPKFLNDIKRIWLVLCQEAENVTYCLNQTGDKQINLALDSENEIDRLTKKFERSHIRKLIKKKDKSDIFSEIIFIEMLTELERIGDHLANIAERAPEIQKHYLNISPS